MRLTHWQKENNGGKTELNHRQKQAEVAVEKKGLTENRKTLIMDNKPHNIYKSTKQNI